MASVAVPETDTRRAIMTVLFVGVFMSALDSAIIGPIVPALRAAFAIDNTQVVLVSIIFTLCSLSSTTLMASLSDRYGRRHVYLLNVFGFAIGSLVIALSHDLLTVLIGRALQGICAGGITPTASAVIGDVLPPVERAKALGLIGATSGMAFLIGPVLASLILAFADWQWIFLLNLPVAAAVIVLGWRALPRTNPHQPVPHDTFDWSGLLLLVTILVSLTLGINQLLDRFLGMTIWPWLFGLVALLIPVLAWREQQTPAPLLPPRLFTNRQLQFVYLLATGSGIAMASIIFITSVAVNFGVPISQAGFFLLPLVFLASVTSIIGGRMLPKIGGRAAMLIGYGQLTVGNLMLGWPSAPFWLFVIATIVVGSGLGIVVGGTLRALVLEEVAPGDRGVAQSVINISISIGTLISVAVMASIADTINLSAAYLACAAVMALMTVISLGLRRQYRT
ncbi:MAG: MFS transporter [Chloroflexus sp.]|uniref:MFS transporter n=1 Tax=Chloroflexus sp. TaxID=1904827 RepID=UPI0021DC5580|nr:MFS transporter [Chloroflexus sp.]GIV90377.1 MAG: MFS transporter [Chloroflexus sp.]